MVFGLRVGSIAVVYRIEEELLSEGKEVSCKLCASELSFHISINSLYI